MKFCFQGDSITHALRHPQELNNAFQLGNGYVFLIAARLLHDRPERCYQFLNQGVCGEGVRHLLARWERETLPELPAVLTLLVGVNDTLHHFEGRPAPDDAAFESAFRLLLDSALQRGASPMIVLEPFLLETENISAEMAQHLRKRAQAMRLWCLGRPGVYFIPLQERFDRLAASTGPQYWAYDGIHPTAAGFRLIADAWMEVWRVIEAGHLENSTKPLSSLP